MNLHDLAVAQPAKMLNNLKAWLEKGRASAEERGFDPSILLHARLAPDQYHLIRQVQVACDNAKFIAERPSGKVGPKYDDVDVGWDELVGRVDGVLAFLATVQPEDMKGAEDRLVAPPVFEGKKLRALDYLVDFALPNFYFHLTCAYEILRHNGVALTKQDYIGSVRFIES